MREVRREEVVGEGREADRLFRALTRAWRERLQSPELPFLVVQLPGMGRPTWPAFRAVQQGWLDDPHVALAVAIDAGHESDVHPTDKRPVGERLARLALVSGEDRRFYPADAELDRERPSF